MATTTVGYRLVGFRYPCWAGGDVERDDEWRETPIPELQGRDEWGDPFDTFATVNEAIELAKRLAAAPCSTENCVYDYGIRRVDNTDWLTTVSADNYHRYRVLYDCGSGRECPRCACIMPENYDNHLQTASGIGQLRRYDLVHWCRTLAEFERWCLDPRDCHFDSPIDSDCMAAAHKYDNGKSMVPCLGGIVLYDTKTGVYSQPHVVSAIATEFGLISSTPWQVVTDYCEEMGRVDLAERMRFAMKSENFSRLTCPHGTVIASRARTQYRVRSQARKF